MDYVKYIREMVGNNCIILNGSNVIILDTDGKILLQRRAAPPCKWGLPGGIMELGESTQDTARREVFEETSLKLGQLSLFGVYSGAGHLSQLDNGHQWYNVVTVFICSDWQGTITLNDESLSLEWFAPLELPENIATSHKKVLDEYVASLA